MGYRPSDWLTLTPGELFAQYAVYQERCDRELFLQAWLASHIGPMVKAQKSYSPWQLAGFVAPTPPRRVQTPEEVTLEWRRMMTATGSSKGH